MKGWTLTKVWQVDHKLVVADTITEAVELFKSYMGTDYKDEPCKVESVSTSTSLCDRYAIIKEEER